MSAGARARGDGGACPSCLRRRWLLAQLSAPLDYCARDRARLLELLALADAQLIAAVGGRRRDELGARYTAFDRERVSVADGAQAICRHRRGFPRTLAAAAFPCMLEVAGGARRLQELTAAPVVAIVGARRTSGYGVEVARSLARGLAASGVTVAARLLDGIAPAVQAGAREGRGGAIAAIGGGLGTARADRRALLERIVREGCVVAELPRDCSGRRWGQLASARTIVGLAALTIVVEAERTAEDLAAAAIARSLGRSLAAIPGRVSSPLSRGAHLLLRDGAHLLTDVEDALELLCGPDERAPGPRAELRPTLQPRLRTVLELVGAGSDTPETLARESADPGEALLALSELELMGWLTRGEGGRYLPRLPLPATRASPG